ncbi:unnamed protein product, partial [Polarella glacialis]
NNRIFHTLDALPRYDAFYRTHPNNNNETNENNNNNNNNNKEEVSPTQSSLPNGRSIVFERSKSIEISSDLNYALLKFVCHPRAVTTIICVTPRYNRSIFFDRSKSIIISSDLNNALLKFVCHRRAVTTTSCVTPGYDRSIVFDCSKST